MMDTKDRHETLKPGTHVEVLSKKQVDGKCLCGTIISAAPNAPGTYIVEYHPGLDNGHIPKTNYRLSLNRFASIRRPGRSKRRSSSRRFVEGRWADGTRVTVGTIPVLSVTIQFSNGSRVKIQQDGAGI